MVIRWHVDYSFNISYLSSHFLITTPSKSVTGVLDSPASCVYFN